MKKILLLIPLFCLLASPVLAATPTHDASSNSGAKTNESSTSAYTHTAGTLTSGVAIIRVSSQDSTPGTISGVTYNGAAATQIGSSACFSTSSRSCISLWYYKNPPSGASAVVATFSEVMNAHIVNVSTYSNVNQASPIGTANSATDFDIVNPSEARVTITSAVGELVVGLCAFATATGAATAAAGSTDRGNVLLSTNTAHVGLEATGAASVNIGCTLAESRNNGALGVSLKPSVGPSAPIFLE